MFIFDPDKDKQNKKKHGISLNDAVHLWEDDHIIIPAKNIKDEQRYIVLGKINKKIYACVFTYREDKIRIISCHRADKKLERYYNEKIK
jgi:uncharacterized DUF497 family protein